MAWAIVSLYDDESPEFSNVSLQFNVIACIDVIHVNVRNASPRNMSAVDVGEMNNGFDTSKRSIYIQCSSLARAIGTVVNRNTQCESVLIISS